MQPFFSNKTDAIKNIIINLQNRSSRMSILFHLIKTIIIPEYVQFHRINLQHINKFSLVSLKII